MTLVSRLKLRTKLTLLMGLSSLALFATLAVTASLWHQRMINDRVDKLRAVVQSAMGIAQSLQDQIAAHKLTQEQAIAVLRDQFHRMRFDQGEGYLTAQTPDGIILIHGTLPDREGKPSSATDADGRPLIDIIHAVLKDSDAGVVAYRLPKPGHTNAVGKVAFVAPYAPWNVTFLAGAYVDDLEAAFHSAALRLAGIGALILLLTLAVAWAINRDITGGLAALTEVMDRLAHDELAIDVPGTERGDEIGTMARAVQVFKESASEHRRLEAEQQQSAARAEAERRQAVMRVASEFESEVAGIAHGVAGRVTRLEAGAKTVAGSVEQTGQEISVAAAASEEASAHVQSVAGAADELSVVIGAQSLILCGFQSAANPRATPWATHRRPTCRSPQDLGLPSLACGFGAGGRLRSPTRAGHRDPARPKAVRLDPGCPPRKTRFGGWRLEWRAGGHKPRGYTTLIG